MCLGIPAQIVEVHARQGVSRPAVVRRVDGAETPADLAMLPEATLGDFVILHSGYAVCMLSTEEASHAIELLTEGGLVM